MMVFWRRCDPRPKKTYFTIKLHDDDGSLPEAGLLAFTPPGDEMIEVVSRCLPHRQLWVSNFPMAAT